MFRHRCLLKITHRDMQCKDERHIESIDLFYSDIMQFVNNSMVFQCLTLY